MKKIVYGIVGMLVLVIAAVIALPFLVPAERIKEELILAVNDSTGRTLAIDGDFGVSVFPVLGLNASEVSFSNAANSAIPNMATIGKLTVALDLIPLLTGKIQVDTFILDKPVISLEVDKNGTKNWDFAQGAAKPAAPKEEASSDGMSDLGIQDLNLGNVKIVDGAVTYSDAKSGVKHEISAVNLVVLLNGLDSTFKTEGSVTWNNEVIELGAELGALRAVLENKATTLKASVKSTKVTVSYDGSLGSITPLSLNGNTDLNVPSVKELADWVGQPMEAKENTFGPMMIKGTTDIKGDSYAFKKASLSFDKITGAGDFKVNLGGKVPYLEGNLDIPLLDVNPYMSDQPSGETKEAAPAAKNGEKWDNTEIDFSGLKALNAKLGLSVDQLLVQKITVGKSAIALALKNGRLKVDLNELNLYEGVGKGNIVINARGNKAKISSKFSLQNIKVKPFLADAAGFDKIEGTGLIQFATKTSGNSQKAMVEALGGTGKILFENGAISGVNLAAMARNVTSAFSDGVGEQKTDFAELSGAFNIVKGILTNKDLKMLNPFVRLSGAGTVSMPPKTLDYRVEPKLVATTEGQGGKDASGLVVPIKISGSWDSPNFAPDLAALVTQAVDPKAIKKKLEETGKDGISKALKGGKKDLLNGGIKDLFGKIK